MTNFTQELEVRLAAKRRELQARLVELRTFASAEVDGVVVRLKRKLSRLDAYVAKMLVERTTGTGHTGARP